MDHCHLRMNSLGQPQADVPGIFPSRSRYLVTPLSTSGTAVLQEDMTYWINISREVGLIPSVFFYSSTSDTAGPCVPFVLYLS